MRRELVTILLIILILLLLTRVVRAQETQEICFSGCIPYTITPPEVSPSPSSSPSPSPSFSPAPSPSSSPVPSPSQFPAPSASPFIKPVPEKASWEINMRTFGEQWCDYFDQDHSFDQKLNATYYDAEAVYYNMFEYLDDFKWENCAKKAQRVYGDQYVDANNGFVPGYWSFTHGLLADYLKHSDSRSLQSLLLIAENAAFHSDSTPVSATKSFELSRENAYAIMAYLNAEKAGQAARTRLPGLVNNALGHIDQWFVNHPNGWYVKPFMVGITARALIEYDSLHPDPRVLPAVIIAADGLWDNYWLAQNKSFTYISRQIPGDDSPGPAPDLNLLIAPLYAWIYQKTGDSKYRDRGDEVFSGGVTQAWLGGPKQFNQNYTWSFDYIRFRE